MTDHTAELDEALEQVVAAARAHLAAVRAAGGALDDEQVWHCYVALNNASASYDQLLLDSFGEVTPWETEPLDVAEEPVTVPVTGQPPADPYPSVVSVRQRRDYRVPSVTALLAAAEQAARRLALEDELPAPETVSEAVLGLMQAGDGSLGALDVPVLEPLEGVVTVTEVARPLDLAAAGDSDGAQLFHTGAGDRLVARMDEHPYLDLTDNDLADTDLADTDLTEDDLADSDGGDPR
jgi:hypothetical protein